MALVNETNLKYFLQQVKSKAENITYDFEEVDSIAHSVEVPRNSLEIASVDKIGGMSYSSRNLINTSSTVDTRNTGGIVYKKISNGGFRISGTSTAYAELTLNTDNGGFDMTWTLPAGTYTVGFFGDINNNKTCFTFTYLDPETQQRVNFASYYNIPRTFTLTEEVLIGLYITVIPDTTVYNTIFPYLVRGENPLTEFEPYYEDIKNAPITNIKSIGQNLINGRLRSKSRTENGLTIQYLESEDCYLINGTAEKSTDYHSVYDTILIDDYLSLTCEVLGGSYTIPENASNKYIVFYVKSKDSKIFYDAFVNWEDIDLKTSGVKKGFNKRKYIGKTCFYIGQGITFNNYKVRISANKGSVPINYEPYWEHNLSIPETIRNLPGYGLGINEKHYNYVDFDRKVYVQRVKMLQIGGNEQNKDTSLWFKDFNDSNLWPSLTPLNNQFVVQNLTSFDDMVNLSINFISGRIVSNYLDSSADDALQKTENRVAAYNWNNKNTIRITIENAINREEANNIVSSEPIFVIYPINPIETDISNLLNSTNFIKTKTNGRIIFENENNYDIPNTISYQTKIGG